MAFLSGLFAVAVAAILVCHGQARASRRLIRSIASAARAASPPLLSSLARARAQACASVLTVMMPLPSGIRLRHRKIHQRARGFHRDDLEMDGVAPDHAAQRDHGVIGFAVLLGGIERDRNRRRNFQRAGNGDDVVADAGGLQLGDRAFQQRILDVVIEARLDDQRARAGNVGLVFKNVRGARLPLFVHSAKSHRIGRS